MTGLAREYAQAYGIAYRWALRTPPLSWLFSAAWGWPGSILARQLDQVSRRALAR